MKTYRFGQSAVLSSNQLDQLIAALPAKHHQVLAEVCRRTGCRISEGRQLQWQSISQNHITFPKTITKAKLKSRTIPQVPKLREVLAERHEWAVLNGRQPMNGDFVFPGRFAGQCLSSRAFMDALNGASNECGLQGVSSHSFRRSALTSAHNAGVPLSHLMELSGHTSMSSIQRYLYVTEDQKDQAAMSFA